MALWHTLAMSHTGYAMDWLCHTLAMSHTGYATHWICHSLVIPERQQHTGSTTIHVDGMAARSCIRNDIMMEGAGPNLPSYTVLHVSNNSV